MYKRLTKLTAPHTKETVKYSMNSVQATLQTWLQPQNL